MKGIILAGGLGTRLYPLTKVTNKHLLPIYNKPMIYYPIKTLVDAGITDIKVIVSGPHTGHFLPILKHGEEFGCNITYAFQEKGDGGIADALSITESFASGHNVCVILGDNTTDANLRADVEGFDKNQHFPKNHITSTDIKNYKPQAKLFYKEVKDPSSFGVIEYNEDKTIKGLIEKPKNPPSNHAVTGIYMYDSSVYHFIKHCKPSDRGQLEITDVNNLYLENGNVDCVELNGYWQDAGTFDNLYKANRYWRDKCIQD